MLPMAGQIDEGVFAAVAMGDQGTTMAMTIARKARALIEGKKDALLQMCLPKRFIEGNS